MGVGAMATERDRMTGLTLGPEGLELRRDLPRPEAAPGEAVVEVTLAGVCSTDLELVRGYAGFQGVLGHEFVGLVESAPGAEEWLGRRVVGAINFGCRDCPECLAAGPEHCPHRTVLGIVGQDGAFAERVLLPVANLLEVPETVPDEAAVFTEPLAAALRIREQLPVAATAPTAVVGPGRLGLLIAQVLALGGGEVAVLGRRAESLDLPRRLAKETGLSLRCSLADDAPGDAFDLVVEATGDPRGLEQALRLVRPRGTVVLKSTYSPQARAAAPPVDLTKVVVGEVTLVGSRCGPFAPALRTLERRAVAVTPLVAAEYPLAEARAALEHAARPGVRKVLLRMPGGAPQSAAGGPGSGG